MNAWEEAILKTYDLLGGNASNQEIYERTTTTGKCCQVSIDYLCRDKL